VADLFRRACQPAVAVVVIVAGVNLITMAISYEHEFVLARRNGQIAWVAGLVPFSVDGILVAASVALYWAGQHGMTGLRRLWQPLVTGAVGIAATVSANMVSDLRFWWLGPAVAASSGLSLVLISWVAFWLLRVQREQTSPEPEPVAAQPAADCSCPPPAVTLTEALRAARAELQRRGEPTGEQKLADRFGVTRHQVRTILVEPSVNGHGEGADR